MPTTLDEMIAAVKKLHDPDHGVYGIALRGQRGSGANVWRWMPISVASAASGSMVTRRRSTASRR